MNKLLNTLLRTSITASLSDREAFTDNISRVIEDKIGTDPDAAKRLSDNLAIAMESINDQLLINELISPTPQNDELENKIDKLTASIDRLNTNIEKLIDNGNR